MVEHICHSVNTLNENVTLCFQHNPRSLWPSVEGVTLSKHWCRIYGRRCLWPQIHGTTYFLAKVCHCAPVLWNSSRICVVHLIKSFNYQGSRKSPICLYNVLPPNEGLSHWLKVCSTITLLALQIRWRHRVNPHVLMDNFPYFGIHVNLH